jgi:molybdopterin-binding protein
MIYHPLIWHYQEAKQIPITPCPTGRVCYRTGPGNELPGYDRLVPTGHGIFSVAREPDHADGPRMSQSIRNRIPGTITEITSDPVMTEVILETAIGPVAAVITTRSANDLGLKIGDSVHALVKATNVSVEKA